MKLVLNPSHRELESFMLGLPEQFSSLGECIYKARNELRRFTYGGKSYVVKGYKVPLLINRIAYTFFRPGKASRAYEYAMRLRSMGIETPEPIAYIEIKRRGLLWHSFFVSDHCPYSGIMRDFEGGNIAGKEDILKAFAAFTVKLHEKGIFHLDYSAGNILFERRGDEVLFSILDLNRMRFVRMTPQMCLGNFNRFCRSEKVVRYVVEEYARLRGWEVSSSVEIAMQAYRRFWGRIERKDAWKNRRKSF